MHEAGVTGYEASQWLGLFAPAGTPAPVITRISDEARRILALPASAKAMAPRGLEPRLGGPADLANALRTDIQKWSKVMDNAQIRLDQ